MGFLPFGVTLNPKGYSKTINQSLSPEYHFCRKPSFDFRFCLSIFSSLDFPFICVMIP